MPSEPTEGRCNRYEYWKLNRKSLNNFQEQKSFITVLVNLISLPSKKKVDLPVRKMFFWRHSEKMLWGSFFYVIFIKKMYIRAKLKECIFRQKRSVHIRENAFHLKLHNFAFCESWASYKGGTWWKSDPSVKSPKIFEGGGGN